MGEVLQKIMPQGGCPVKTNSSLLLYNHISGQCHPAATAMTV
jgi:hypothetical protein